MVCIIESVLFSVLVITSAVGIGDTRIREVETEAI